MFSKKLSVMVAVVMTVSLVLSACAQPTPVVIEKQVTVEVEKEVPVEKKVVETVVVEKEVPVVVTATPPPEKITLRFTTIGWASCCADAWEAAVEDYEAAHPNIDVIWEDIPAKVREYYMSNLAAGTLADVAEMDVIYGYPDMAAMGALHDLDELCTPEQKARFYTGPWNASRVKGNPYGAPFFTGGFSLWYNEDILEEAGLDYSNPPKTWLELLDWGKTVYEKTGTYGLSFYISDYLGTKMLMQELGPSFVSDDYTTALINTPRHVEVLRAWVDAYKAGAMPPEAVSVSEATNVFQDVNWFTAGHTALMQREAEVAGLIPEGFRLGTAPPVTGDAGIYVGPGHWWSVPIQSKHPEEAVDLMIFLSEHPALNQYLRDFALPPGAKKAAEDPMWEIDPETATQAELHLSYVRETLDSLMMPPIIPGWGELVDVLKEEWTKAFLEQVTPEEAVTNIETRWNEILAAAQQ
jgi:ABC-type glycerol-3-phosphate transport system substrate-binding protein